MGRVTKTSKLRHYVGTGQLRNDLHDVAGGIDEETIQYLIDIVCRATDKPWRKKHR